MKAIAVALLAVAVGGCAAELDVSGARWTKDGARFNQITLDETDCARGALDAGWTPDLILGGIVDVPRVFIREAGRRGAYNKCMRDRGYRMARG